MNAIPVIYSFARSGGTLVNQLLGIHPQCLVLSEVNPASSYKPVMEQAVEWLGLVAANEAEDLAQLPYHLLIGLLHARATEQGKRLIVRDWTTVNFIPGCTVSVIPSKQLEQMLYLRRSDIEHMPLVVARRSAAVFASIKHNFQHLHSLEMDVFAGAYLEYARAVSGLPRIHLESLQAEPAAVLSEILRHFNLDAGGAETLLRDFSSFSNCTGNTTLQQPGPSALAKTVLIQGTIDATQAPFADLHPAMAEADRILGYE